MFSRFFWRQWNFFFRLAGLFWIAIGCGALVEIIIFVAWPSLFPLDPGESRWEAIGVGLLIAGVALSGGVLACRMRPYRPDLGDATWLVNPTEFRLQRQLPRPRRNWWTGDPIP